MQPHTKPIEEDLSTPNVPLNEEPQAEEKDLSASPSEPASNLAKTRPSPPKQTTKGKKRRRHKRQGTGRKPHAHNKANNERSTPRQTLTVADNPPGQTPPQNSETELGEHKHDNQGSERTDSTETTAQKPLAEDLSPTAKTLAKNLSLTAAPITAAPATPYVRPDTTHPSRKPPRGWADWITHGALEAHTRDAKKRSKHKRRTKPLGKKEKKGSKNPNFLPLGTRVHGEAATSPATRPARTKPAVRSTRNTTKTRRHLRSKRRERKRKERPTQPNSGAHTKQNTCVKQDCSLPVAPHKHGGTHTACSHEHWLAHSNPKPRRHSDKRHKRRRKLRKLKDAQRRLKLKTTRATGANGPKTVTKVNEAELLYNLYKEGALDDSESEFEQMTGKPITLPVRCGEPKPRR